MKIIIMCGGYYDFFKIPKQLSVINGERLIDRTIRLLKENNIKEIYISSNDKRFDIDGVTRLEHNNSYRVENKEMKGYWLDAFYPTEEPCIYLYGDVYYSENAIKKILNYKTNKNTLVGSKMALNKEHKNWGEPFAYIVVNQKEFRNGIEAVKWLYDEGKTKRHPITWELYRYLNDSDINIQNIKKETFLVIDDETDDIDTLESIDEINKKLSDLK